MKWTEYPTRADFQNRVNGTPRTGDKWADGPAAGTSWAAPHDDATRYCLVRQRGDGPAWSIPGEDYPRQPAARGAAQAGRAG